VIESSKSLHIILHLINSWIRLCGPLWFRITCKTIRLLSWIVSIPLCIRNKVSIRLSLHNTYNNSCNYYNYSTKRHVSAFFGHHQAYKTPSLHNTYNNSCNYYNYSTKQHVSTLFGHHQAYKTVFYKPDDGRNMLLSWIVVIIATVA